MNAKRNESTAEPERSRNMIVSSSKRIHLHHKQGSKFFWDFESAGETNMFFFPRETEKKTSAATTKSNQDTCQTSGEEELKSDQ